MKRTTGLAYLGSLVLLSQATAGCVGSDYVVSQTPATDAALVDGRPQRSFLLAPAREDLIARWQLPASSPWVPYEKLTLPSVLAETPQSLSMPNIDDLDDVRMARVAGAHVAEDGLPPNAAWFVDLAGAASIAFASSLARYSNQPIAAIPTFNNWPAENELVPAEETLTAMIEMPPRPAAEYDVGAPPVFLLDAWRLAYKQEVIDEGVIDNRYMLTPADFPSAAVLRAQGINQVIYVVGGDDIVDEEDDLHELFAEYEDAGIAIFLVDVQSIVRPREEWEAGWYVQATSHYFHVRRRMTVVHDPRFYGRARGGFGGAHLVPVPSGHVHGGIHGGMHASGG
ncbi:MAG: hypothetical protein ACLQVI_41875 [Polyangiaceae bacterium]